MRIINQQDDLRREEEKRIIQMFSTPSEDALSSIARVFETVGAVEVFTPPSVLVVSVSSRAFNKMNCFQ
jgi:hypothetical protein